jgi:probable phosphoglycerate mutase
MNTLFESRKSSEDIEGVLHFDGSCWPNPGPNACAGFVLKFGSRIIAKSISLGQGTNNIAEYEGLIAGLKAAIENKITRLEVYGDSQIVIFGVTKGKIKKNSKTPHIEALKIRALELVRHFKHIELIWIPREQNAEADEMSTAAISSI